MRSDVGQACRTSIGLELTYVTRRPVLHSDAVLSLAFSRDGARLASGAADRFVKVLDLTGQRPRPLVLEGHTHHVLGVSFKADGRTLHLLAGLNADQYAAEMRGQLAS